MGREPLQLVVRTHTRAPDMWSCRSILMARLRASTQAPDLAFHHTEIPKRLLINRRGDVQHRLDQQRALPFCPSALSFRSHVLIASRFCISRSFAISRPSEQESASFPTQSQLRSRSSSRVVDQLDRSLSTCNLVRLECDDLRLWLSIRTQAGLFCNHLGRKAQLHRLRISVSADHS